MAEIIDCHYCEHALCKDKEGYVDCYAEDGCYFDHHVEDSKADAEDCIWFNFCDRFPKY